MNLDNLDTVTLMQYLPGVNFPAEKELVASTAESNNAPQEMVWRIRNARTQRYNHSDSVLEAVQGRRVF
jgi:Protein of unknown function (DUF2795)